MKSATIRLEDIDLAQNVEPQVTVLIVLYVSRNTTDGVLERLCEQLQHLDSQIAARSLNSLHCFLIHQELSEKRLQSSPLTSMSFSAITKVASDSRKLVCQLDKAADTLDLLRSEYRDKGLPHYIPEIVLLTTGPVSPALRVMQKKFSNSVMPASAHFTSLNLAPADSASPKKRVRLPSNQMDLVFAKLSKFLGLDLPLILPQQQVDGAGQDTQSISTRVCLTPGRWSFVGASATGVSHFLVHKPCEDSFACSSIVDADGNEILVCVASDGAGSARRAGLGSKRVVSAFSKFIHLFVKLGSRISDLTQLDVSEWIARFQHDLSLEATKENYLLRDYMSTLLVAILAKEEAVFFQIGDGAIVVNAENPLGNNDYETVFWPERGQYDNTTFFVTQSNAIDHLQLTFMQRPINRMAMFTDGMQSLALDLKATRTHAPFFEGLFEAVEFYVKKKREHAASTFLKSFLGSERVNRRTDDDKTLILAMRSLLEESKTRQDNYINESNQEENSESSLH